VIENEEKKVFKHMKAHESLFVPLKPNNDILIDGCLLSSSSK
jgi:hypothetical protein